MRNWDLAFDVLVWVCWAKESDREAFKSYLYDSTIPFPKEYRFIGNLGVGGKFHQPAAFRTPYVSCYNEHLTPQRAICIKIANRVLKGLFDADPEA